MNSPRKIVVTGTGAVCGAGLTVDSIWEQILAGRPAIQPIAQWDTSRWPARMASEVVGVDNQTLVQDRKLHKKISRTDMFGLYAADMALRQSGLLAHRETLDAESATRFNDRTGVFAGSGSGGFRSVYDFYPAFTAANGDLQIFGREFADAVNPMWLLKILPNNVLCHVGIRHGFKGTNGCVTNQSVGGLLAVAEAAAAIRAGEAERVVAVGHDTPIEPETLFNYHQLGLLAQDVVRPFDSERSGMIFGEGSAALLLETEEEAQARKATVLGELLGSGCVTEATGILEMRPDGDGLSRAIQLALADAGLPADAVGMIVAHGDGTRASDASEATAIRHVFGKNPPPVTGFKWACGHLISASGTLDLVMALNALRHQIVPGIATLNQLDPTLAPFPVSSKPQQPRSGIAMVLCRGLGGMNIALLARANF
jgi:3-oxoacyl-[acyl-carrier-protein] synthase-1